MSRIFIYGRFVKSGFMVEEIRMKAHVGDRTP